MNGKLAMVITVPSQGNSRTRPLSRFVIGTRGSALAMWQANAARAALTARFPDMTVDLHVIRPEGDIDKTSSLLKIGGRGVFASALQQALLDGEIDMAVHSTKDVPTIEPAGLVIAAFPERRTPAMRSSRGTVSGSLVSRIRRLSARPRVAGLCRSRRSGPTRP